ncbi:MAG: CBS domain-containing protein [Flavobacteriia bacterium]|nr:CBS domain-containing protein [Flavobacteriia bacterium]OIP45709.1 MAG: CBS domain-containing protein [Flavobacteriaceae bacterium CG2_30_31_66]PIV97144.1 MAG: CBS domain-containing protein [Flavobacteriaceae bacterium CG17_big_fil_post_rev_8_21_14_2_50_31_13]PIX13633.1 MAG: CBS domain-containing protein [Flavobacteriaceae bacterium CG_4_8_14_3_um_filter_31_8]PIY14863.1 MAG: CBS domain-containing protein [Flavobacteriaceae bacterium CG_4_10_14_3_um_filter_31_253]PIZ09590.1 MAG: CBS domain-c
MDKNILVSEIMSTDLITLNLNDQLEDAKKIFKENTIRHIPIVKNKEIIGMLSYADILKVSFPDLSNDEKSIETYVYDMFTIEQVMTKNLYLVSADSTVKDIVELLTTKEFHALPVVQDGELVGIVTTKDLMSFLLTLL